MTEREIAQAAVDLCRELFNHYNKESLDMAKKILHLENQLNDLPKTEELTFKKESSDPVKKDNDFPDLD